MNSSYTDQFADVLWIGGATDSGKTTIAKNLALRYGLPVYHYDKTDKEQTEILSKFVPEIHSFLNSSLEERWLNQTPTMMFDFLMLSFQHRIQLVIEELQAMVREKPIIVEGFGILPELIQPLLSSPYQAIWFVPTNIFKWESMISRGKPSFGASVSNPELARKNLFERDKLLADHYRKQVTDFGYELVEIDGKTGVKEITEHTRFHFANYLPEIFL